MKYNMLIIIVFFLSINPVISFHTQDTCQKKISSGKVTVPASSISVSDNEIAANPEIVQGSYLSEEENKKLMQDFNTIPDILAINSKTMNDIVHVTVSIGFSPHNTAQAAQLSEEENERLMRDFNALPDNWLSREENEKLMRDFNALPDNWMNREENENLVRDFNTMPYLSLSDEENEKSGWNFNEVPETMLSKKSLDYWTKHGTIEGYVYLIDSSWSDSQNTGTETATCLPVEGILVKAWSDELNTGYYALTDRTGYYKISGLKQVAADAAELRGYFVEIQADDYPYQVFDQTDTQKEGIKVETGASNIDFYLDTSFTI
ncbi:MAG: hypothetical protein GY749_33885 [Desulfobacteraceae bacterium]|nr:hypothetical protein [Desulfobacteraceae bacterium]